MPPLDPNRAIEYGMLVQAAYSIAPSKIDDEAGLPLDGQFDPFKKGYRIIASIFGSDATVKVEGEDADNTVSFGLIFQSDAGDVVVAIRGTEGVPEWKLDGLFDLVECYFLDGAGDIEDGFSCIYGSLRIVEACGTNELVYGLIGLKYIKPVTAVTICGHSLGSSLATLLALNLATKTELPNPTVYTFASPRCGNAAFAARYNQAVPNTFRIVNLGDRVPHLPPGLLYHHVAQPINLAPDGVNNTAICQHDMRTYLHLLSQQPGASVPIALSAICAR